MDVVSFALGQLRVAHGNLSCRKGRMLPHTGLFLLGKVALQMRIRRRLKQFRTACVQNGKPLLRNVSLNGIRAVAEEILLHLLSQVFARARIGEA
ncbi:hypothetical protein F7O43_10675 [Neisseria meningitidis]|nr:hypothetical protein [Neisseria meningitidis]MVZ75517.1 hypothetical protein [Neisseria meningitidis]